MMTVHTAIQFNPVKQWSIRCRSDLPCTPQFYEAEMDIATERDYDGHNIACTISQDIHTFRVAAKMK